MIPHLDGTFKERGGSGGKTFKQLSEGDRVSGQNIKVCCGKTFKQRLDDIMHTNINAER